MDADTVSVGAGEIVFVAENVAERVAAGVTVAVVLCVRDTLCVCDGV